MNLKIPPMPIHAASLAALTLALLGGCKPHETHGTVDEANAITLEEIAKLGVEGARAKYAGKIVTFKGPMVPVGVSSKNEGRKNVCMQSFLRRFPTNHKIARIESASLSVYFNYGDEISEWFINKPHQSNDLIISNSLSVDFDVCDTAGVCHEGDSQEKCRFNSDALLVTGKVAAIYDFDGDGRSIDVYIRPTGIRY